MLSKNITKNAGFVTILCLIVAVSSCAVSNESVSANDLTVNTGNLWSKPKIIGTITSDEIIESSGLAASRCNPGVFWTHNDSGDDAFIFAINEKGEKLGTWRIDGAVNNDWEDIAEIKDVYGKCLIYIGDIGNNSENKTEFTIYKVAEPNVTPDDKQSSKKSPVITEPAELITFRYPNSTHNAETLLVHPLTGEIYVLTKEITGSSKIFKIGKTAKEIGEISVPAIPNGFLTGGDISSDGKRVVLTDYFLAYELILPKSAANFDEIWKQPLTKIDLGERKQGESVCYSPDGNRIYATSEKKNSPMIMVEKPQ